MATVNLNNDTYEVNSGLDEIVIVKSLGDIPGGRALDVSAMPATMKVIKAGHVIIVSNTGVYKPMPLNGGGTAYGSLPANHSYVGVLKASVSVKDARAAIMTMGQVNAAASPYEVGSGIKSGLPNIQFLYV